MGPKPTNLWLGYGGLESGSLASYSHSALKSGMNTVHLLSEIDFQNACHCRNTVTNHYHHHVNWALSTGIDSVQILLNELKCRPGVWQETPTPRN